MDMRSLRKLHRQIAPILFLPLFLTAFTGVAYRVARSWFNAPDRVGAILMYFHQGTFLGEELRVFYVLLNGLAVVAMLLTGIMMTGLWRSKNKG